jgi:hypothetical protein
MATNDVSGKARLTAELPFSELNVLKELAEQQGVTITEALRRAIATEGLLQQRRRSGSRVLLEKDGTYSELLFTR